VERQITGEKTMHKFEEAGLGKAPFRITGYYRDVGPHYHNDGSMVGSPGQPMGTCDFCGQGIATCVQVRSADGKNFIVGCDCAEKTYPELKESVKEIRSEVTREQSAERRAKQAEARSAKWAAEVAARADEWAAQRAKEKAEREARALAATTANKWLIDVLLDVGYKSDFVESMIETLQENHVSHLSQKVQNILRNIYAKSFGRGGSKKYLAAVDDFNEKIEITDAS
jgi:hypothetical protein